MIKIENYILAKRIQTKILSIQKDFRTTTTYKVELISLCSMSTINLKLDIYVQKCKDANICKSLA